MPIRTNPIESKSRRLVDLPVRRSDVALWYILALLLPAAKHSLAFASEISGKAKSQFSRFLSGSTELAKANLLKIAQHVSRQLAASRTPLIPGVPWTIALIIDATIQKRSSKYAGNAQKFNHGIGDHSPGEIVVLTDAGYDNKSLQRAIINRGWDFISALKCSRGARTEASKLKKAKNCRVDELFWKCRKLSPWSTVRDFVNGYGRKKRKEFRARELVGYLSGVATKAKLVLSEERGSRKAKGESF